MPRSRRIQVVLDPGLESKIEKATREWSSGEPLTMGEIVRDCIRFAFPKLDLNRNVKTRDLSKPRS